MNVRGENHKLKFVIFTITLIASFIGLQAKVNVCSDVSNNIFLPVITNCSQYYLCSDQAPILRDCDGDYLFDTRDQSCTYASSARCPPTCDKSKLSSYCYDKTCTKYVLCYAGTPVISECCDGLQYNKETDRCDYPQYVDCVENMCSIFNDPDNITYISSKASCDKYYVCMDGIAVNQTCANGLQFNPKCNCCDFPSNVNCTVSTLQRNIASFAKAPPRRANIDCPPQGSHFFPHVRSDRYYFCMEGKGVILDCTPGLVFDPLKETCREPQNVGKN